MSSPGTKARTTLASLDKDCGRYGAGRDRRLAPHAAALGLGRDVLAQIDAVKGRKNGRKRGLFALIGPAAGHPNTGASPVRTARAYDVGAPVRVIGAFARSLANDTGWMSPAADDGEGTMAFAIEVFEEETSAAPSTVAGPPVAEPTPPPDATSVPVRLPVPVLAPPSEIPVATALSRGIDEDGMLGLGLSNPSRRDWAEDADQFEREIQNILAGRTTRPVKAASVPAPEATAPSVVPDQPRPHDIFEQMGRNMSYATAFNLPAMELGQRFDQIEQEIAHQELAEGRRDAPAPSLALTDDDIALNLGWARASAVAGVKPVGAPAPVGAVRPVGPAPRTPVNAEPAPAQAAQPEPATTPPGSPASPDAPPPQNAPPPQAGAPPVAAPTPANPSAPVTGPVAVPPGTGIDAVPAPSAPTAPGVPPAGAVTLPATLGSPQS